MPLESIPKLTPPAAKLWQAIRAVSRRFELAMTTLGLARD